MPDDSVVLCCGLAQVDALQHQDDGALVVEQGHFLLVDALARLCALQRQQQRAAFYGQLPLKTRKERTEAIARLDAIVKPMVERYAQQMGVTPSAITYKAMISRWGMCNIKTHAICFSIYTLLLPEWCIEHVVAHELCHLLEPTHNARFHALMDQYFPRWRAARKQTRLIQS